MIQRVLCDICEEPLVEVKKWWKERLEIAASSKHIWGTGYGGEEIATNYDLCPACWTKFKAYVKRTKR